jgi:hypothetical protein
MLDARGHAERLPAHIVALELGTSLGMRRRGRRRARDPPSRLHGSYARAAPRSQVGEDNVAQDEGDEHDCPAMRAVSVVVCVGVRGASASSCGRVRWAGEARWLVILIS